MTTTSSAMETIPNQDKQHENNVHCPVGNSDRPLTEIIELCEDVISIDPDNGLNKTLQENCTLTTTHCNEAAESGCEINTITNLTNGESLAPETYQPNEELPHSMPAKTVNSTLKTQSEKSGPSKQVRTKSSELILGQMPKQNTGNKVKGHKSIKCTKRLSKEMYYDNNITGLIDKSEINCNPGVPVRRAEWVGWLPLIESSYQSALLSKSTTLNDLQRSCKRNFQKSCSNHRPRDRQRYLEFVQKTLHPRVTRPRPRLWLEHLDPVRLRTTK